MATDINCLSEALLQEILVRIPFRFLVQCECVSKGFMHAISSLSFRTMFFSRQQSSFGALFHFVASDVIMLSFHLEGPPILLLPSPKKRYAVSGEVCGSSCGMILFCDCMYSLGRTYHIYNPLNKKRINIPVSPYLVRLGCYAVGFVHTTDGRFRVVLIEAGLRTPPRQSYKVQRFISEQRRWEWIPLLVVDLNDLGYLPQGLFPKAFEGKLYFMGSSSILEYDPFVNSYCNVIPYPEGTDYFRVQSRGHFGHSCGSLRMADIDPDGIARVWELQHGQIWQLLHTVVFPDDSAASLMYIGCFHPYSDNILYMHDFDESEGIMMYNTNTMEFTEVPANTGRRVYRGHIVLCSLFSCFLRAIVDSGFEHLKANNSILF
ncbi:unnamed protein product [Lupinus luteus]|uniref:F-box protein n=1 Tax=Lupinus luteus TaxID=3873 RepID=A0AAV1YPB4_LUPLU